MIVVLKELTGRQRYTSLETIQGEGYPPYSQGALPERRVSRSNRRHAVFPAVFERRAQTACRDAA